MSWGVEFDSGARFYAMIELELPATASIDFGPQGGRRPDEGSVRLGAMFGVRALGIDWEEIHQGL